MKNIKDFLKQNNVQIILKNLQEEINLINMIPLMINVQVQIIMFFQMKMTII
jgi:hypothetical protein